MREATGNSVQSVSKCQWRREKERDKGEGDQKKEREKEREGRESLARRYANRWINCHRTISK
ncbi:hypothetical protein NQZ68_023894 [Dissostichus eleginoides]|nr:hypothetical protein NQZ68_023894 [Dissostichus eleginoides]